MIYPVLAAYVAIASPPLNSAQPVTSDILFDEALVKFYEEVPYFKSVVVQSIYDREKHVQVWVEPLEVREKRASSGAQESWRAILETRPPTSQIQLNFAGRYPNLPRDTKTRNHSAAVRLAIVKMSRSGRLRGPLILKSTRAESGYVISFDPLPLITDGEMLVTVDFSLKKVSLLGG